MADLIGGVATQDGQNVGTWLWDKGSKQWVLVPNNPATLDPRAQDPTGTAIANQLIAQFGSAGTQVLNLAAQQATAGGPAGASGALNIAAILQNVGGASATSGQLKTAVDAFNQALHTAAPSLRGFSLTRAQLALGAAAAAVALYFTVFKPRRRFA